MTNLSMGWLVGPKISGVESNQSRDLLVLLEYTNCWFACPATPKENYVQDTIREVQV